jgi:hypothetical protein
VGILLPVGDILVYKMIDIANENVPEDLVSAGKKSCQYSYRLIESNGSIQLFMLAGPFYIVKVPIVKRR